MGSLDEPQRLFQPGRSIFLHGGVNQGKSIAKVYIAPPVPMLRPLSAKW